MRYLTRRFEREINHRLLRDERRHKSDFPFVTILNNKQNLLSQQPYGSQRV